MKARRPADLLFGIEVAERRREHVERQLDAVRIGLERIARGRHVLLRRAARKLLRTIAEVA